MFLYIVLLSFIDKLKNCRVWDSVPEMFVWSRRRLYKQEACVSFPERQSVLKAQQPKRLKMCEWYISHIACQDKLRERA